MRMLFSLSLAAAVGAGAVFWMPPLDRASDLAVITEVTDAGFARVAMPATAGVRAPGAVLVGAPARPFPALSFDVSTTTIATTTAPRSRPDQVGSAVVGDVARWANANIGPAGGRQTRAASSAVVQRSVASRAPFDPLVQTAVVRPAAAQLAATNVSVEPTSPLHLARDLQRELKRVGCYAGPVDGDWGPMSRRAMAAFVADLNSRLPSEVPDFILLTLLQGHAGSACASPADGVMTADRGGSERLIASLPLNVPAPVAVVRIQPQLKMTEVADVGGIGRRDAVSVADVPGLYGLQRRQLPDGRMAIGGPIGDITPPAPVLTRREVRREPRVTRRAPPPRATSQPRSRRNTSWTENFFRN